MFKREFHQNVHCLHPLVYFPDFSGLLQGKYLTTFFNDNASGGNSFRWHMDIAITNLYLLLRLNNSHADIKLFHTEKSFHLQSQKYRGYLRPGYSLNVLIRLEVFIYWQNTPECVINSLLAVQKRCPDLSLIVSLKAGMEACITANMNRKHT